MTVYHNMKYNQLIINILHKSFNNFRTTMLYLYKINNCITVLPESDFLCETRCVRQLKGLYLISRSGRSRPILLFRSVDSVMDVSESKCQNGKSH